MGFKDQEPGAAAQREGLSDEEVQEHQRIAAFNTHPHTRLTRALGDLNIKRPDINDRIGALHRAVAAIMQLALEHTPPPEQEKPNVEKRNDEQSAVRTERPVADGG